MGSKFVQKRSSTKKYDALADTSEIRNYNSLQVNQRPLEMRRAMIQTQGKERSTIVRIEEADNSRN
jgi:hypothetical protein